MTNRSDIFKRLQEYEVQPPPEVFQHLLVRLQAGNAPDEEEDKWQGAFQQLQLLEIQPPSFMPLAIANAIVERPLFSSLQEMAIAPPAGAFGRIMEQVSAGKDKTEGTIASIKKLFSGYRAIAAVLLLVVAGWGIYRFAFRSPGKTQTELAQETTPKQLPVIDSVNQPAVHANPEIARYELYDDVKTENYFKNNVFTVEGAGMPLVDNDFMVTFASFTYEELPSFITEEEDSEMTIRLDQYSYFTISENMMNSIKKMYQRRSRGTPTRRARKEKEKLERWKKADAARFDQKHISNPLDPIDLAEFIFKY